MRNDAYLTIQEEVQVFDFGLTKESKESKESDRVDDDTFQFTYSYKMNEDRIVNKGYRPVCDKFWPTV